MPDIVFLCRAWGETEYPCFRVCRSLGEVAKFFADEWFGEEPASANEDVRAQFDDAMECLREGDDFHVDFEIGGIAVERSVESK